MPNAQCPMPRMLGGKPERMATMTTASSRVRELTTIIRVGGSILYTGVARLRSRFGVAQFASQNLAYIAARQVVSEFHVFRSLIGRELMAAMVNDLLFGEAGVAGNHKQLYDFAGVLVGHPYGGGFDHVGVFYGNRLDFIRIDVES